jgi:hypothetical protein
MALTDISGIGSATADKLKADGINTKQQLLQAFRQGDSRVVGGPFDDGLNARAIKGIREELTSSGQSFVDPVYNIPVTEENERAREAFDLTLGSDVAEGFGDFTRDKGGVDAGMNVLEAAGEAISGDLGATLQPESYEEITPDTAFSTKNYLSEADDADRATKEAFEFGLDAAANVSPFERRTIEKGNELSRQTAGMGSFTVQQKTTEEREVSDGTIEAEENMQIDAREYARARNFQRQRSMEAKRVDNNRKAPVTDEITTWKDDPSHWDYPGMDTPGGKRDIVVEDRREQAKNIDRTVSEADEDVTEIAFGNPLESMF